MENSTVASALEGKVVVVGSTAFRLHFGLSPFLAPARPRGLCAVAVPRPTADDMGRREGRMEEAMETIKSESIRPGTTCGETAMSCEKYREALIDAAAAGEQVNADLPNTSRNAHSVALHCNASKCCLRRSTTLWAGE
jgi:hypothetical protein